MSGTWEAIAPTPREKDGRLALAVRISINVIGKRGPRSITLSFDPAQLEGIEWLRHGQDVTVALGRGEFAGRVRVSKGGPMALRRGNVRRLATNTAPEKVMLSSPGLAAKLTGPATFQHSYVQPDWSLDWIEFELPRWLSDPAAKPVLNGSALTAAIAAKPPVAAPATAPARIPYRGPLERLGAVERSPGAGAPIPMGGVRP